MERPRLIFAVALAALIGISLPVTFAPRAAHAQVVPEPPPPVPPDDPSLPPPTAPAEPSSDPDLPQIDPNAPRKPLGPRDAKAKTVADVLKSSGQFTTLLKALNAAGLTATLQSAGPFTIFAPSDAAFAKLPKARLDALLADKKKLADVLKYHVLPARLTGDEAKALAGQNSPPTLQGGTLKISVRATRLRVNSARVMKPDIDADNGVIHEIDVVLMPPTTAAVPKSPGAAPPPVPPTPEPNAPVTPAPLVPGLPVPPPSDPSLPPPPPPFP